MHLLLLLGMWSNAQYDDKPLFISKYHAYHGHGFDLAMELKLL